MRITVFLALALSLVANPIITPASGYDRGQTKARHGACVNVQLGPRPYFLETTCRWRSKKQAPIMLRRPVTQIRLLDRASRRTAGPRPRGTMLTA